MGHNIPCLVGAPGRMLEIPERLGFLSSAIGEIQESLEVLTARLASVTGEVSPPDKTERGLPSSNTEIGEQITIAAHRCELINARLRDLIDRLEV